MERGYGWEIQESRNDKISYSNILKMARKEDLHIRISVNTRITFFFSLFYFFSIYSYDPSRRGRLRFTGRNAARIPERYPSDERSERGQGDKMQG